MTNLLIALLCVAHGILGQKSLPANGINDDLGGIFGIGTNIQSAGFSGVGTDIITGLFKSGKESPPMFTVAATNGGSGPYKAQYVTDAAFPNHTIYAPKTPPPASVKMPVIVFGNGGCTARGAMYPELLTEIASYGYVVVASGPPKGTTFSKVADMVASLDWVMKNGASKFGSIDKAKIAAAGQSCGGLEAYSTSYREPRVKLTMIFNVGVFDESRRYLIKELKTPIAWFLGGPPDAGYQFGVKDYGLLSPEVPAALFSLDAGHTGTYSATGGGKFGKAAVAFLEWQFRGNETAKRLFKDPAAPGSLVQDKWNVTMRNM